MERIIDIISFFVIASTLLPSARASAAVRRTTLVSAWRWSIVGLAAWTLSAGIALIARESWRGGVELVWYTTALLMLCPAIAVLGAQRPVVRVWSWFVVLPFLLVFGWPAAASTSQTISTGQFQLQTPMAVGYAFVVVMGLGNYVGTRFTFPALLAAAALWLSVLPLATAEFAWLPAARQCRPVATLLLAAAVWWADRAGRGTEHPAAIPLDRVWEQFRDRYGIVWSKRLLDRLNHMAEAKRLSLRMSLTGIAPLDSSGATANPDDLAELERASRWLLRRFVDDEWIDDQLQRGQNDLLN